MNNSEKIFIGAAWPYANGPLHLGHVASLLPADILARYHRLKDDEVLFVSGSDCHGTPISMKAQQKEIEPKQLAEKYDQKFRSNLIEKLGFSYDVYSKTTESQHKEVVQEIFLKLLDEELLYEKTQELPYCENCDKFLPDRYVEGECPHCDFEEARGDQCDDCGSLLDADELINPRCKFCGETPQWKESTHFFLKLSALEDELKDWVESHEEWRTNAYQYTLNMLEDGLEDRAVTRDIDWGIDIPVDGYEGKKIYVWFEAVSGYLSASKRRSNWKDFWKEDAFHYYVHGKDNIAFHTVIWPTILTGLNQADSKQLSLPDQIVSSEYLNLEGKQLSTSRNWAIWLDDFLQKYNPDSLRYYLTINGPETADANFTWESYQARNNKELVAKYGNFVHRTLNLIESNYNGEVPEADELAQKDKELLDNTEQKYERVGNLIEQTKFRKALKEVFELAEQANQYIDQQAPWDKINEKPERAKTILHICVQLILNLRILTQPFLPFAAQEIKKWSSAPLKNKWKLQEVSQDLTFTEVEPLFESIDDETVEKELKELKEKSEEVKE